MKLWDKGYQLNKEIEAFTVGDDYLLDGRLVRHDCAASIAHAKMLCRMGLLSKSELARLVRGLEEIIRLDKKGGFRIKKEEEDCHTAIENRLVSKYGDAGKKVHTARSRNDQVLTALRLYEKESLGAIKQRLARFKTVLKAAQVRQGKLPLTGYTHMRRAMPTTVGAWLGCFLDSAEDNALFADFVLKLIDQSPLGSAAGYGVPVLRIDKRLTAKLMGFSRVMDNPVYAQMSRNKFEATIAHFCSQVMFDLNKMCSDLIMFSMPEFGFVKLPDAFCTGSSIMPQKKNPDVLELVRGKYHIVLGEEFKIKSLAGNLISGYNRDIQLAKAPLFACLDAALASLGIMSVVVEGLRFDAEKCAPSGELYATEEVYKLVKKGMPFRDAYRKVAEKYC
ncbi:MAG: argininosuccinate lyase [Elusimicrobia bacterium CG_4_10_14_0_2_um_filter_56_8]|nr:MAG: argininosuccinate lyase [Elusimicrobia bacterium CG1_02_56_21]PJA14269.1 MAG: argininosuccinate lyase [Elusimicrobia bacterium CG_4_10_14_0_2_um_filter_56_8]